MPHLDAHPKLANSPPPKVAGEPGKREHPAWVTEDLIQQTLHVWQPRYKIKLSRVDAVGIILSVSRLFGALSRG